MSKYTVHLMLSLLTVAFLSACQPQNSARLELQISELKKELKEVQEDVSRIADQVEDIHKIATQAQKPQYVTLPTQVDFAENGQLAMLGDARAELAIIEFSDFQCPYCKRFIDQTFPPLKSNYIDTGKVKYLTRDFPLPFHKQAQGAAIAANCSLQQNGYWPMRAALFKNPQQLGEPLYQQTATALSFDMDKFAACLADPAIADKIRKDIVYGKSLGIKGTPSFLIGRIENNRLITPKLVVGAQSYETFSLLLNELLALQPQE